MQTQQTITFFGTVSYPAISRTSKNGRKYTAFGVSIISDRNLQAFHYNVVAWGKQGHFAKPLQKRHPRQARHSGAFSARQPRHNALTHRNLRATDQYGRMRLAYDFSLVLMGERYAVRHERLGQIENQKTQTATKLEAVHVCEKCETRFRPDQVNEDVNITGVIECKICSHIGSLRILVLPQEQNLMDKTYQSCFAFVRSFKRRTKPLRNSLTTRP